MKRARVVKRRSQTQIRTAEPERGGAEPEGEMLIDTSRMNKGQAAAMEVAEAARDASAGPGFAAQLFLGHFDDTAVMPFPEQEEADRRRGDELVAQVSAFLAEHLDPEEVDATRSIPAEVVEGLQDLGVFRMKVPAEYGGLGLGQVNYNRVLLAIASYCGSTAVLVSAHQSIGVPNPLKMFGTDAQKDKYFRMIADGALSAFALTEAEVGSDPARMTTRAEPSDDGTHWILDGTKVWTTNGPVADLLVVMAQTPSRIVRGREKRRITAFIVETDWPGVEVVHRCDFMGLRGIQNGVMRFTNVKVPAENVIWGEGRGLKLALRTLNTGRLTLPAACAGIGKQCLRIAREWGGTREQWGQPIGRHEAGADKIADIAATTFAMDAVWRLTSHWAEEERDIRIEAAMAKLFCSEAAVRLADRTLQLRGGRGYERATSLRERGETPYPVERMYRDCRINTIIEGTTDIMHLFLAREALDPHLQQAADLLRPGTDAKTRARAAVGVLAHYAAWYPPRVLGAIVPRAHAGTGRLKRHLAYLDLTSSRLALAFIHRMGRHGPKLERRQLLLARLVDIGTELFAMAATLSYARSLAGRTGAPHNAEELADLFCRQARARVTACFRALRRDAPRPRGRVAQGVLEGRFTWMEDGIVVPRDAA